jgi:hypothetical protein
MDALRGSLSNAESFGRGFAVAPVGLLGDIEGLLRKGVNLSFGRGGVNVSETPVLPTTEGLLSSIPRMTAPRMETAGMEQIGSAANPRGPINLGRAVASLPSDVARAGKEFMAAGQPVRVVQNLTKDQIQTSAESLANTLNDLGYKANVIHSGSKAGASSYVNIFDPQTGRFFNKQIRFSGHGKGPKEASGVIDVQDLEQDIPKIIDAANNMRLLGPSKQYQIETKANELIASGIKPKSAYKQAQEYVENPPFIYPQEEALRLAQQRAALPVEQGGLGLIAENTPEMRAKAMGFDVEAYHGTNKDFLAFDKSKRGSSTDFGWYGSGEYSSPTTTGAEAYAMTDFPNYKESANIIPLLINNPEAIKNKYGYITEYVTREPEQLRSRFAAFDPFRKDVATATAMGVALPDLLAAEYNQQPQSSGLLYPLP